MKFSENRVPGGNGAAVSNNPYLQSMYAAAAANAAAGNPYAAATGIPITAASGSIPLGAATAQPQWAAGLTGMPTASGQSTGNPLLDAYAGQYAALAAAQGMYGSQAASVAGNPSLNGLDATQAGTKILFYLRQANQKIDSDIIKEAVFFENYTIIKERILNLFSYILRISI